MTQPILGEYVVRDKLKGQESILRKEVSLYIPFTAGLEVSNGTSNINPDTIQAQVFKRDDFDADSNPDGILALTFPDTAMANPSVGTYVISIPASLTQEKGLIKVIWSYTYGGMDQTMTEYFVVLNFLPTYNDLSIPERSMIDRVQWRFADLYDSMEGGPHLLEEFQSKFGPERIAQIAGQALAVVNYTGQPTTSYTIGGAGGRRFPAKNLGILEWATYIEVVKHLIRSYTEQPVVNGASGFAILDRRDYTTRWMEVLRMETEGFTKALGFFKRDSLNLGGGSLIVAGGLFGSGGYGPQNGLYYTAMAAYRRGMFPVSYVMSLPGPA